MSPAIEAVLMMLPLSCFSMTGSTCFIPKNTPTTLTSITLRNMASGYSVIGLTSPSTPALL